MTLIYRPIRESDEQFLKEMLYEALFVPPDQKPFDKSIIDQPEIAKYLIRWNTNKYLGLIVMCDKIEVGAVWCQQFTLLNKGYGYIDDSIPELTIAIKKQFRNSGIGTQLLQTFILKAKAFGYNSISLSVDKRNPAYGLYKRLGFTIFKALDTAYTMKIEIQ